MSVVGAKAENICSQRAFRLLTRSGLKGTKPIQLQEGLFDADCLGAQRRPVPRRTREAQWARTFTQDHQLGPRAAARWARAFARSIGRRLRLGRFPVGPRASRPPLTL